MQDARIRTLRAKINALKTERNAVILAHNYQLGEVLDVADVIGDSLELAVKAAQTQAEVIVSCGVTFMAETAFLLNPGKTVLLPNTASGCAMADMATAEAVRALKAEHPGALVVTYVNSSAEVKAESDICVTSANAVSIIQSIPPEQTVIFVPDCGLGAYCEQQANRKMILWEGYCPVHMRLTPEMIRERQKEFPEAVTLIHPESHASSIACCDKALSTGGMLRFVRESNAKQFIIATEIGLIHRLKQENPEKQFIPVSEQIICPTMKMHRLEDVLHALETNTHVITVPEAIREAARRPIERMLAFARKD